MRLEIDDDVIRSVIYDALLEAWDLSGEGYNSEHIDALGEDVLRVEIEDIANETIEKLKKGKR